MASTQSPAQPIPYTPAVETPAKDEQASIDGIIEKMTSQSKKVAARENGHTVRASHAKSTALVTGSLTVADGLPKALAQGLFATPGKHDVAIRYAQGPGEVLHDSVSTHRGVSIKVFSVPGPKLSGHAEDTQDFVLASGPTFPSGTAAGFLRDETMLEKQVNAPESLKSAASSVARTVSSAAEALTGAPIPVADFFGHPFSHPLSEPYYSQAPLRWGDYVAKVAIFPAVDEDELKRLQAIKVDTTSDENAFRTATVDYFKRNGFKYEVRAQLWNNEETQPIEDSAVQWKEEESPFVKVGVLEIPAQAAYSKERQNFFDERMSFKPGHALEAHRPLGSIMRTRLQVYNALTQFRHDANKTDIVEPVKIQDIPA